MLQFNPLQFHEWFGCSSWRGIWIINNGDLSSTMDCHSHLQPVGGSVAMYMSIHEVTSMGFIQQIGDKHSFVFYNPEDTQDTDIDIIL